MAAGTRLDRLIERIADADALHPVVDGGNRLIGEFDRSILMRAFNTRSPGAAADTNGETDAR